jgi:inhibitor of cysteine peptidase
MEIRTSTVIGLRWAGALVAAALLGAALLVACGGGQEVSGQTIKVTASPGDTTSLEVKVGDTIVVKLEANATTGYEWQFTAGDTFTIESSNYVPSPAPSNMVGTGGSQIVTLKVTRTGSSDLTGTYRQQWNSPSPDAQPDFSMTIVSTD